MWLLYQAVVAAALVAAAPWLLLRRGRHYLATLPGRLGRYRGESSRGALWIHAVSVGEVAVAATLAEALPASLPLLVTTITPTGQARARAAFAGRAAVAYLPFDLGFAVRRFFGHFEPAALVLVEGDYWPLVLREAARRRLPVAVVNGRVSDRSFPRLRRWRRVLAPLLFERVDCFAVQTEEDRRRLAALGVAEERLTVTGNLKYDTPAPPPQPELEADVRRLAAGRPLLIAGSTMEGEEALVLDAFAHAGGGERALLLLAPRHTERCDRVARLVTERGFRLLRRSRLGSAGEAAEADVLLLDTLGELASLYRLGAAVFIGGTLVPTGGHNPLEPARFGVPVVVGPSMENFREMAGDFDRRGAWRRAKDARQLARVWDGWLEDTEAARAVGRRAAELVEANRGAVEKTVELLRPVIAAVDQEEAGR